MTIIAYTINYKKEKKRRKKNKNKTHTHPGGRGGGIAHFNMATLGVAGGKTPEV